jgi:hypothetical protein
MSPEKIDERIIKSVGMLKRGLEMAKTQMSDPAIILSHIKTEVGYLNSWSVDYPLKAKRLDHVAGLWERLAARIKLDAK